MTRQDKVAVLEVRGERAKVRLPGGRTAWVKSKNLRAVDSPAVGPSAEPAWAAPLRVVGGVVGLLRAHADRAGAGEPVTAGTLRRLADRLAAEHAELHRLLHGEG